MNEWVILSLMFASAGVALYFFVRTKMDPRVEELAGHAYRAAAMIAELPVRGSAPSVRLKDGPWETRGVEVLGTYNSFGLFRKVLWDSVLVTKDPARIWDVLVHEMTHAVRRRNGKPSSEAAAYATKPLAAGLAPPNLAALLEKL